jgi:hypothetical protein
VARVVIAPAAVADLERLILTHSLPAETGLRVRRSIEPLAQFPLLGAMLGGRWGAYRFILGPWRWLLIVYAYDAETDLVAVLTVQDARSSSAVTATR